MNMLAEKTALIFGVANDHSIAWGIAKAMHEHGARVAFSYSTEKLKRRVRPLADSLGASFVEKCDVSQDDDIERLFTLAGQELGTIDILVHAIAFANRDDLLGRYVDTSRDGFRMAMDISVYSLTALAKAALPLLAPQAAILTLSYHGGEKVVPNYNVMGIAKAALESSMRYLAADLGPQGIRVNAISAGPVRTLSAAGVSGFRKMHRNYPQVAPLRSNISIEDVGNAAVWLCSSMAAHVTGETLYVDSGYNILGITEVIDKD